MDNKLRVWDNYFADAEFALTRRNLAGLAPTGEDDCMARGQVAAIVTFELLDQLQGELMENVGAVTLRDIE